MPKSMFDSHIHGPEHAIRVYINILGIMKFEKKINEKIALGFAMCHDIAREDDFKDPCHGQRAAEIFLESERWKNPIFKGGMTEEEATECAMAIMWHSESEPLYRSPTANACYDADRLDFTRLNIFPDPARLYYPISRTMAASIHLGGIPQWEETMQEALSKISGGLSVDQLKEMAIKGQLG